MFIPNAARAAGSTVYLPDVLPGITLATLDGPAPAAQTMRLDIALTHPNAAGEQAAYSAMYNPSSPSFHQFLTPAQYDATFGVSQSTADAVDTWLSGGGLDVFYEAPSRDLFEVSGTVAQINALFQTTINRYTAGTISFLANPQEPAVPVGLPIESIVGLNTLQRFYTTTDQAGERPTFVTTRAPGRARAVSRRQASASGTISRRTCGRSTTCPRATRVRVRPWGSSWRGSPTSSSPTYGCSNNE